MRLHGTATGSTLKALEEDIQRRATAAFGEGNYTIEERGDAYEHVENMVGEVQAYAASFIAAPKEN